MTKEELIGRKFRHSDGSDPTYTITAEVDRNRFNLNWFSPSTKEETNMSWDIDKALTNFKDGTWKLLPEDNKMYKTPKGIEYGVGTQYLWLGDKNHISTILEITNDKVICKLPVVDKREFNKAMFESELDSGDRAIITTMKDYKQVDPKTINFDFNNTKIKVNSEDESKWVLSVAHANGLEGLEHVGHSINNAFYFKLPYSSWDSGHNFNDKNFGNDRLKEITIQDILNNMKEVIEVGDTVKMDKQYDSNESGGVVTKIDNNGYWLKDGGLIYPHQVVLVNKKKTKEVVGYETVVDLPGIPKGSKNSGRAKEGCYNFTTQGEPKIYTQAEVTDTKFFKPIYKQDTLDIKFSKYTAKLSKEEGLVFSDGEKLDYKNVNSLVNQVLKPNTPKTKFGKFDVTFEATITKIKVGCKSFTADDVKLVSDAIKKLE